MEQESGCVFNGLQASIRTMKYDEERLLITYCLQFVSSRNNWALNMFGVANIYFFDAHRRLIDHNCTERFELNPTFRTI